MTDLIPENTAGGVDIACAFTTGGVILFYKAFILLNSDPIDMFIKEILVQQRTAETEYVHKDNKVKWRILNDIGLIFCIAYREI